jgi:hypothetical protein
MILYNVKNLTGNQFVVYCSANIAKSKSFVLYSKDNQTLELTEEQANYINTKYKGMAKATKVNS